MHGVGVVIHLSSTVLSRLSRPEKTRRLQCLKNGLFDEPMTIVDKFRELLHQTCELRLDQGIRSSKYPNQNSCPTTRTAGLRLGFRETFWIKETFLSGTATMNPGAIEISQLGGLNILTWWKFYVG